MKISKVHITLNVDVEKEFTVKLSDAELSAIKHIIGKTSIYDRIFIGMTEDEAELCSDIYQDIKGRVE